MSNQDLDLIRNWILRWSDSNRRLMVTEQLKSTLHDLLDEIVTQRVLDKTLGDWKRAMCVQVYDALARRDKAEAECKRLREELAKK